MSEISFVATDKPELLTNISFRSIIKHKTISPNYNTNNSGIGVKDSEILLKWTPILKKVFKKLSIKEFVVDEIICPGYSFPAYDPLDEISVILYPQLLDYIENILKSDAIFLYYGTTDDFCELEQKSKTVKMIDISIQKLKNKIKHGENIKELKSYILYNFIL